MDYRTILATGFLLLCGAVFVHSLKSANAFPQGPNVSMGSNPVESIFPTEEALYITYRIFREVLGFLVYMLLDYI